MSSPEFLTAESTSVLLALKVQPRASANTIAGPLGAELRIKLTAPPVDDAANTALVRFLADRLHCARAQIQIVRGHASRHKLVRITGLPPEAILQHLID